MNLVDEIQICEHCEQDMEYMGLGEWTCECGKNWYAEWLDGPALAAWFRMVLDIEGLEGPQPSFVRKLRAWETGTSADFYKVDGWMVKLDLHVTDLPDYLWREAPRRGPVPPKLRSTALKRIDGGETVAAVATDLGINPDTIGKWRKRSKVAA